MGNEFKLSILIVAWYSTSTMQNIWSKKVLKRFPHPMTLTLCQFGSIALVMPVLMQAWNKRQVMRSCLFSMFFFQCLHNSETFHTAAVDWRHLASHAVKIIFIILGVYDTAKSSSVLCAHSESPDAIVYCGIFKSYSADIIFMANLYVTDSYSAWCNCNLRNSTRVQLAWTGFCSSFLLFIVPAVHLF
eukprot:m.159396 g.159396  ORF g.159396 m.159396 type:complete len:188 (-) comp15151_c1_seq1:1952-2515(-)